MPLGRDEEGDPLAALADPLAVLGRQPRHISYPDYKTKEDFTTWVAGYGKKIQYSFGYKNNEYRKVREEVVRSISGKLTPGAALDAYERLTDEERNNYDKLITRLTEEFTDPRVKQKFNDNKDFNKRKKGQTLKEYAEVIKRDLKRYSDIPETMYSANGALVPNPARERDGIKRFIKGMRNEEGKLNEKFRDNLGYHLMEDDELNWKNAISVASRWERIFDENASGTASEPEPSGSSSSSSSEDDDVKAVETKDKKKKKKKKGKKGGAIAAIADQVHENQMRITKLETAQERMTAAQEGTNYALQEISAKLDLGFAQGNLRNQSYTQPRIQQNNQQPRSQMQQYQLQQQQLQQRPRPPQYVYRPQNNTNIKANPAQNTWGAKVNQPRQGNFGFNRRTPATFPTAAAAAAAPTAAAAPSQSAAKQTVAAVEETEVTEGACCAELLEEESISVPMSHFISMATQAGIEVPEDGLIAGIEELNFC